MTRLKVRRLAKNAGLDPDDVVLLLLEDGMEIETEETVLSGDGLKRAKAVLREARMVEEVEHSSADEETEEHEDWPTLDDEPVRFLTRDDVVAVHHALVREFAATDDAIEPPGLRDESFLEAALFRPQTGALGFRKYPNVHLAGAALLHSLVLNHPFFNGNKRTALVSFVWYLRLNGHMLLFNEEELYELVVRVADHKMLQRFSQLDRAPADDEVLALYRWIKLRSRPPRHGDKMMIWHRLERILRAFGCTFDTPRHGKRNIYRDGKRCQIAYARAGMDVNARTIKKIRDDLGLTDDQGIDSTIFYAAAQAVKSPPEIICSYRNVLRRLAKYDRGEILRSAG